MTNMSLNSIKIDSKSSATIFLETIFSSILENNLGDIEIRTFNPSRQYFINSIDRAVSICSELSRSKMDAYFGVNPRTGKGGKKANIHFVTVFHAEIDYGKDGHKKAPVHETYLNALDAINKFSPRPSMVIHSGGGFHCYWVLETPLNVQDTGLTKIESINRNLSEALGGDTGTQDISRVLRIPGTFNFKLPDKPRLVEAVYLDGPKYQLQDFEQYMDLEKSKDFQADTSDLDNPAFKITDSDMDIEKMPVSEKIKFLVLNGNDGSYPSRSEADMAVVAALVYRGVHDQTIKEIFEIYPIGEKYRTHAKPDAYLQTTIQAAKKLSNFDLQSLTRISFAGMNHPLVPKANHPISFYLERNLAS